MVAYSPDRVRNPSTTSERNIVIIGSIGAFVAIWATLLTEEAFQELQKLPDDLEMAEFVLSLFKAFKLDFSRLRVENIALLIVGIGEIITAVSLAHRVKQNKLHSQ